MERSAGGILAPAPMKRAAEAKATKANRRVYSTKVLTAIVVPEISK